MRDALLEIKYRENKRDFLNDNPMSCTCKVQVAKYECLIHVTQENMNRI